MANDSDNSGGHPGAEPALPRPDGPDAQQQPPLLPHVRAFMRQASAVIATERGLGASAQRKLELLANELKLQPAELDSAMARLKADAELPTGLTRYEREYVLFLRRELEHLSGAILTVSMEKRAIDLATSKYQIPESRARHLLWQQAGQFDVGRISRDEAKNYVGQLVANRIGDATRLEESSRQRFYQIGTKWGVDESTIDEFIEVTLGNNCENQEPAAARSRRRIAPVVLLFVVGVTGILAVKYRELFGPGDNPVVPDVPEANRLSIESDAEFPDWWNAGGLIDAVRRLSDTPQNASLLEGLTSDDNRLREDSIRKLTEIAIDDIALKNSKPAPSTETLSRLFYFSPSPDVEAPILDGLEKALAGRHRQSGRHIERLSRPWKANRLLHALRFFEAATSEYSEQRQSLLDNLFEKNFGVVPESMGSDDILKHSDRALAADQWQRLIGTSWSAPRRTAAQVAPLVTLTRNLLPPEELKRSHRRTVLSILESDPGAWTQLKPEIEQAIESSSPGVTNLWINHYEAASNREYREWLGERLAAWCSVEVKSRNARDIEQALLAVRTRFNREKHAELLRRSEQLDVLNREIYRSVRARELSPQRLAEISRAVTLNAILVPHDGAFDLERFDRVANTKTPNLAELARQDLKAASERGEVTFAATPSDRRNKSEAIAVLADPATGPSASATALLRLAALAPRFADIPYSEASGLAKYYLNGKSAREAVNAEKALGQFSRWSNFGLAIADRIVSDEKVELDHAITVAQAFGDEPFMLSDPANWRQDVRNWIFENTMRRLQESPSLPDQHHLEWKHLRSFFLATQQDRFELAAPGVQAPDANVVELVATQVEAALDSTSPAERARSRRAIHLILDPSTHEVDQLVALNRILARAVVARAESRWPQHVDAFRPIIEQLDETLATPASPPVQLAATELALLKLFSLERTIAIDLLCSPR